MLPQQSTQVHRKTLRRLKHKIDDDNQARDLSWREKREESCHNTKGCQHQNELRYEIRTNRKDRSLALVCWRCLRWFFRWWTMAVVLMDRVDLGLGTGGYRFRIEKATSHDHDIYGREAVPRDCSSTGPATRKRIGSTRARKRRPKEAYSETSLNGRSGPGGSSPRTSRESAKLSNLKRFTPGLRQ